MLAALLAACATVPDRQHDVGPGPDHSVVIQALPCGVDRPAAAEPAPAEALPATFRLLSWNLHKNADNGWDRDLARFAADRDLLLIQEAALTGELRHLLESGGYDWLLASAFLLDDRETGVLTAARVRPAAACTQRFVEPLLQLPKSTVITRYAVQGLPDRVAVANLHAINFSLALGRYREQLDAIGAELAHHRGPVILAGDFNTWSPVRTEVVIELANRLGLAPVVFPEDKRSRFLGQQVDFLFVRGLDVVDAQVPEVDSSDHNPVLATLRVPGAR